MTVRMRDGQAMLEYLLSVAALLVVVSVLAFTVQAGFRSSERSSTQIRSDCP